MRILYFLAIAAACNFVIAHEGHDHGHDHNDHSSEPEPLPESESEWQDRAVHSINFNGFTLKWKDDPNDNKSVIMKMSGRATGYVAVGFCVIWRGTMQDCDIILGWVDSGGRAQVYDYFAPANTQPVLDDRQDVNLIRGSESNGITSITFKRRWDTGDDAKDANLDHNQNVHVMYAWHDQDPFSSTDFKKHGDGTRGHTLRPTPIKGHQHAAGNTLLINLALIIIAIVYAVAPSVIFL